MRILTLLSLSITAVSVLPLSLYAEIITKEVSYQAGDTNLKGYFAYDDSIKQKRPGIIVVHEWWGQNEYVRQRAQKLAALGYTALAIDMYGEGKSTTHPDNAMGFMKQALSNMDEAKMRFIAGKKLLESHPTVDTDNLAAIGYCFGGGVVLQMARLGVPLDGVVSFHGSLASKTRAKPGDVKAAVLVAHGADDSFIKQEDIDALKQEMKEAKADFKFISYPNAEHSFTNPKADEVRKKFGTPLAYSATADAASWADMKEFFKRIFAQ